MDQTQWNQTIVILLFCSGYGWVTMHLWSKPTRQVIQEAQIQGNGPWLLNLTSNLSESFDVYL